MDTDIALTAPRRGTHDLSHTGFIKSQFQKMRADGDGYLNAM